MEFTRSKKNWKCPTDRELILRAKINVGWSVHSGDVFRKSEPIPRTEVESIEKVIRRSKQLERMEFERIGRMICRLENMEKNVIGDGKKNCSMCGISFGLFKTNHIPCFDCSKAVCEKCRIDTQNHSLEVCTFCKICAENREVWKKSGGWFYGKLPTGNQVCEEILQTQSSNSPSLARAYGTWEHMAPDIVRMQSFEPPEENHNDHVLYTNWAVSTSPDLNQSEDDYDDDDIIDEETIEFRRKNSEDLKKSEKNTLLGVPHRRLSVSCPSLKITGVGDKVKPSHDKLVTKKKLLKPARKLIARMTRAKDVKKNSKLKDT